MDNSKKRNIDGLDQEPIGQTGSTIDTHGTGISKSETGSKKQCSSCGFYFHISDFPKKGSKRREHRCRDCHNNTRRSRHKKAAAWLIDDLPVEVELVDSHDDVGFIPVLFGVIMDNGFLELPANVEIDVDELLNCEDSIDKLFN